MKTCERIFLSSKLPLQVNDEMFADLVVKEFVKLMS